MSFNITMRQGPARLVQRLPELSKSAAFRTTASRAFHQASPKQKLSSAFFSARTTATTGLTTSSIVARSTFRNGARSFTQQTYTQSQQGGSNVRKLVVGGAIFGGTLVAINAVFNREMREDGGMPPFEREYLNSTFLHTGLGVGIIALTARQMINTGFVYRLMLTSGSEPYAYLTAPVIGSYIVCNESVPYYQGRKFLLLKHAETEINEEGESESNIPEDCVAIRLVPQCAKLADLPAGAIAS
ncbi:hypothetical protein BN1708_017260, partial [Verticillium longisporum]